ncbi:hypothetical protein [Candidatus Solirubrobacter pratensis]|uniref:hypothetical protein n=1 Tax=Candidatus Solirubrobacter pratensis TaxID=1298857 RepID=UPI0004052C67|nr:hypothetical protein [Candidatus Solirubrobacter pratensis]
MEIPRALRSRPYGPPQLPTPAALTAAAAVVLIAALGGWALAAGLTFEPAAAPEARPADVRLGSSLALTLRAGWKAVEKVPRVPGLEGRQARAFAPADGGAGRMVLAVLPDATGDTLPSETAAALRTPLGRSVQRLTIGGRRGAGYTALAIRDVAGIVDVYAVPTVAGVLAVACVAPLDDPLPVGACPADIVDVAARRPPAPDSLAPLRAKLPAVVAGLDRARRAGRRDLRAGATSKAQARAAGRLAAAYRHAAKRAAGLAPDLGTAAALPAAFSAAAAAYGDLRTAASRHSRPAWRRSRVKVDAAERAAAARLDAVRTG